MPTMPPFERRWPIWPSKAATEAGLMTTPALARAGILGHERGARRMQLKVR